MGSEVLNLYKESGETPLERLKRFRETHPEYRDVPMTYAGRLDPLAEGVLLVLAGEERFKREAYLALPKQYRFEVLWGFATDTEDVLGLVSAAADLRPDIADEAEAFQSFIGTYRQEYPAYSSKPAGGKPLHAWARQGSVPPGEKPAKDVSIFSLQILDHATISDTQLLKSIEKMVASVSGDFRQPEILERWGKVIALCEKDGQRLLTSIRVECGSGMYVRALVRDAARKLGVPALAFRIVRERVGEWTIEAALRE